MRKLKTLFALLVLSFFTIGNVWGDEVTLDDFGSNTSGTGYVETEGSLTDNSSNTWKVKGYRVTNDGLIIGKGGANYLQTPEFSGDISAIQVTWSGNANYYLALQTTSGTELDAIQNTSSAQTKTFTVDGSYKQLRLVGRRASGTSNAAATITEVVVTYGSTKTLISVAVSGTPTKTAYAVGDAFNPAGLTVTGTYDVGDPTVITSGITWTACKTEDGTYVALDNAAVALAKNETGIYVKATASEKTSPAFHVTGLKVQAALTDDELAWDAASFVATKGGENTFPTLNNTIPVSVTYQSTDETVATISNEEGHEGEITLLKSGETTIKAVFAGNDYYAAKTVSYTLSVIVPVESVSVKASTTLEVGDTEKLTATITPNGATNKNVTWESSNKSVATVSEAGVVTAVAAGSANITCKSAADNTKTATCAVTVVTPHVYTYSHDFTEIDFTDWGSYAVHAVKYTSYGTQPTDSVYFASASKQTGTSDITDRPVTKGADVKFILLDNSKYISAVKFECKQWTNKTTTITLQYSTDGGTSFSDFDPAISASFTSGTTNATSAVKCTNLPAKVNAVKISGSNTSSQVGISSVSFDLVDKVTYAVAQSTTGCTLSVLKGETPVSNPALLEEGEQLTVSIASTETGYENASIAIKKTSDNSDVTEAVLSGSTLTVPNYGITIVGTATKIQYTVTLSATNGKIQVGGVDKTSISVAHGETAELTAVANDEYAFQNWTSEGAGIALGSTSDNPMTITVTGEGTVTANFRSTAKTDPALAWNTDAVEAVKGQAAPTWPTLTNSESVSVAYSSTNTDVAEINASTGAITIKAVGSTTIKATHAEDETYSASVASFTLTVKGRITWHVVKESTDDASYEDYEAGVTPVKPANPESCDEAISFMGWTTAIYDKSDVAPATLYTGNVPAVTDNADYYAVWAICSAEKWAEVTSLAKLTAGTYAICTADYFMKAEISSSRFANGSTGPSITSGKLNVAPATDCQWEISIVKADTFLIKNGTNYAGAPDEKNKGALLEAVTDFAKWKISYNDGFVVKNVGRANSSKDSGNAYLRNNTTNGWGTYTSSYGGAPRFFKYAAATASNYSTNCNPDDVPTAIENTEFTETNVKAVKVMREGQIFILRGDKVYTVQGQLVK